MPSWPDAGSRSTRKTPGAGASSAGTSRGNARSGRSRASTPEATTPPHHHRQNRSSFSHEAGLSRSTVITVTPVWSSAGGGSPGTRRVGLAGIHMDGVVAPHSPQGSRCPGEYRPGAGDLGGGRAWALAEADGLEPLTSGAWDAAAVAHRLDEESTAGDGHPRGRCPRRCGAMLAPGERYAGVRGAPREDVGASCVGISRSG